MQGVENTLISLRHCYVARLFFLVATAMSSLATIAALLVGSLDVSVALGVMFVFCAWQLNRWQANTGQGSLACQFAVDAATELQCPTAFPAAVQIVSFFILVVVVPVLAVIGIVT